MPRQVKDRQGDYRAATHPLARLEQSILHDTTLSPEEKKAVVVPLSSARQKLVEFTLRRKP